MKYLGYIFGSIVVLVILLTFYSYITDAVIPVVEIGIKVNNARNCNNYNDASRYIIDLEKKINNSEKKFVYNLHNSYIIATSDQENPTSSSTKWLIRILKENWDVDFIDSNDKNYSISCESIPGIPNMNPNRKFVKNNKVWYLTSDYFELKLKLKEINWFQKIIRGFTSK